MIKTLKNIVIITVISLFLTGCKKDHIISDKQTILFQFEYVNYAWGYQHNGIIINNAGNILTYSNPDGWNFPDNDLILDESQVTENISKCMLNSKRIPKDELQKYSNYIKNIASSKVTALKNVAADAGSSEFICYQFSENTKTYKGYLIKMEGDFTCENLNFYSKKVVAWIKDIDIHLPEN
ncbi:MAG TPA: hypothetical protein VMV77_00865 [Bacteroidales bacterium]|nr:hypothetical protein [Bacteroidales bacterium]